MNFEKPNLENINNNQEQSSEKEKELIERLEELPIRIDRKVELLLAHKEEKLADEIEAETNDWRPGEKPNQLDEEELKQIEELIKDMDLHYTKGAKQIVDSEFSDLAENGQYAQRKKEQVLFFVAKKKENLDKFAKAYNKDAATLGELYGFPASARNNYIQKGDTMRLEDMPSDIKDSEAVAFGRFDYSKECWQEELKTGQRWAEAVKKASPRLYQEYMEHWHKVSK